MRRDYICAKMDVLHAGQPGPRDPNEETFLAFARVFSGVLRDGQRLHVLSAAYKPRAAAAGAPGAAGACISDRLLSSSCWPE